MVASNKFNDFPMRDELIKELTGGQSKSSIESDLKKDPEVEFTRGYPKENGYYQECALGKVKYPKPSKDLLYDPRKDK